MSWLCSVFAALMIVTGFCSCNSSSIEGKLYITEQTNPGTEIITIKILEHTSDQSTEKNIFSEYKEKISYGDYTWFVYDIPNGTWDVYIEYYKDGDYRNEREEVYIEGDSSGNGWAAICLVDNYDYSVCTGQGKGELNITSSLF